MNAISRIELALLRAASQMGERDAALFRLVADEVRLVIHANPTEDDKMQAVLDDYRKHG